MTQHLDPTGFSNLTHRSGSAYMVPEPPVTKRTQEMVDSGRTDPQGSYLGESGHSDESRRSIQANKHRKTNSDGSASIPKDKVEPSDGVAAFERARKWSD